MLINYEKNEDEKKKSAACVSINVFANCGGRNDEENKDGKDDKDCCKDSPCVEINVFADCEKCGQKSAD